jgi:hypothetical protein
LLLPLVRTYNLAVAKKKNAAAVEMARLRTKKLSPKRRKEISDLANDARMTVLSPEKRSEIARRAVEARWEKYYAEYPEKRKTARTGASRKKARRKVSASA